MVKFRFVLNLGYKSLKHKHWWHRQANLWVVSTELYYFIIQPYHQIRLFSFVTFLIFSALWLNFRPSGFLFIRLSGFGLMDKSGSKAFLKKPYHYENEKILNPMFLLLSHFIKDRRLYSENAQHFSQGGSFSGSSKQFKTWFYDVIYQKWISIIARIKSQVHAQISQETCLLSYYDKDITNHQYIQSRIAPLVAYWIGTGEVLSSIYVHIRLLRFGLRSLKSVTSS